MFKKLAQSRLFGIGRAQPALPKVGHRARRAGLVCRWHQAPSTGALECVWQSVDVGESASPRLDGRILKLKDARAAARRPFIGTAA